MYNIIPAKTSVQHHTSENICTSHQQNIVLHTSNNICTTSHQQQHMYITPATTYVQHHTSKNIYNITPAKTSIQHYTSNNICTSHQQKTSVQHHTSNNICTTPHQQKHLYSITPAKTSVQHHTSKNICTASHQQKHLYNITPTNICTTSHQQKHVQHQHQQQHLYNATPAKTSVQHHTSKYIYNVILGKTSVGQQHMSRSVSTTPHQQKHLVQRRTRKNLLYNVTRRNLFVQHHQEKPCTASHKVVSLSTYCSCIILHPELPYILLCTEIFLWNFHKKGKTGVSLSWYISTCAGTNYIRWHSSVIIEECFFNRHYKLMSSHKSLVFHQTTLLNLLQIINKPTENNNKQGHHRFPPIVIEITWFS